jgi:hypothetical protein
MKKALVFAAAIPGALAIAAGVFAITLLLVKVLWAWTVPDLFPGAVEQGLVARSISWLTSLKVAIFVAVLAGVAKASRKEPPST